MGSWIAVVVVVVVVVAGAIVVGALLLRRRRGTSAAAPPAAAAWAAPAPSAPPMTDLESALAKVTDRDGRPIREKIDAESAHVDPLRDPNDTGPLLRRALDSVAHPNQPDDPSHQVAATDPAGEPGGEGAPRSANDAP